jgi:hypothetical protein
LCYFYEGAPLFGIKLGVPSLFGKKNWLVIEIIVKNSFPSLLRKQNCWSVVIREKHLLAVGIKETAPNNDGWSPRS